MRFEYCYLAILHIERTIFYLNCITASLAQLVEQCFRKAWVAGSSPVGGSDEHIRLANSQKIHKYSQKHLITF